MLIIARTGDPGGGFSGFGSGAGAKISPGSGSAIACTACLLVRSTDLALPAIMLNHILDILANLPYLNRLVGDLLSLNTISALIHAPSDHQENCIIDLQPTNMVPNQTSHCNLRRVFAEESWPPSGSTHDASIPIHVFM